uniref:Uncharacterized protein n=1 Tax=Panagrolaimus sp. JU765 TaxID=591449 RepID=A0AC34RL99_9BILA
IFFSSNTPEKNICITEEEILYIRQQTSSQNIARKAGSSKLSTAPVPWTRMGTSSAVYANIIAQFSFNFSAALLQTYLPTYMKQVLKVEIGKNGIYAMLPFLTQLISKNIFGILSDALKRHKVLTSTQAVKIFQVTGNIGAFLCFLTLALFIDCTRTGFAVAIFALYGIFFSAGIPGFFTSLLSIAPSFTGTLFSISMLAGNIGNAASPGLVGLINKHGTETEWMYIWLLTATINLIAAIVFTIFGSADIQEWAKPEILQGKSKVVPQYSVETQMKTVDLENQEKPGILRKKRISDVEPEDFIN